MKSRQLETDRPGRRLTAADTITHTHTQRKFKDGEETRGDGSHGADMSISACPDCRAVVHVDREAINTLISAPLFTNRFIHKFRHDYWNLREARRLARISLMLSLKLRFALVATNTENHMLDWILAMTGICVCV